MIALFVEGPDDKNCYTVITENLGVHAFILPLHGKGNLLNPDRVGQHLKALSASPKNIEKVIVIVDADCNEQDTIQQTQSCITALERSKEHHVR